jgi:hypothetical protein
MWPPAQWIEKRARWGVPRVDLLRQNRPRPLRQNRPLPRVSCEEARRVWESQRRPSARNVAQALSQAGRHVHFATINRWRKRGWRTGPAEHPLDTARAALDSAVPILMGSPRSCVVELVEKDFDADQLRELSDQELVRTASREIIIALIRCSRVLRERVSDLVSRKPMEVSILISAMSQCLKAAVIGLLHGGELEPHASFFRQGHRQLLRQGDRHLFKKERARERPVTTKLLASSLSAKCWLYFEDCPGRRLPFRI